jgi:UDP-N-acetylglucosamine 2-epimerase (non-hydrolysing)
MIIRTGSPMNEVLSYYQNGIDKSDILQKLKLDEGQFFVISSHREENIDSEQNFRKLIEVINRIAEKYKLPVIVSTHPRTKRRIDISKVKIHEKVQLLKPLGFKDYNKLQISSKVVLSDSGTISEESSILNFPALNIRESHERPEGMEEAAVMMVGLEIERIFQAITILDNQPKGQIRVLSKVFDYTVPNVSDKVVRIIHSYTDYVNRVVWRQY